VSKIVLNNPENSLIKTPNRFKDIAVFVVWSFFIAAPCTASKDTIFGFASGLLTNYSTVVL